MRTQPIIELPVAGYRNLLTWCTLWPITVAGAGGLTPPFPPRLPAAAAAAAGAGAATGKAKGTTRLATQYRRTGSGFHPMGDGPSIGRAVRSRCSTTCIQVVFRPPDRPGAPSAVARAADREEVAVPRRLPSRDEGLLPYPQRSQFPGYRLLTEFFAFPARVPVPWTSAGFCGANAARAGFTRAVRGDLSCVGRTAAEPGTGHVGRGHVPPRLYARSINLFEPARPSRSRCDADSPYEYRVVPDVAHPLEGLEVYSVDAVAGVGPRCAAGRPSDYRAVLLDRPSARTARKVAAAFLVRRPGRRLGARGDRGDGRGIRVARRGRCFDPRLPCRRRSWPCGRPAGPTGTCRRRSSGPGTGWRLNLEGAAPISEIRCPRPPTLPLRPPRRRGGAHWRLLSHLNLNHLSLADGGEGQHALQEVPRLYDFSDPESGQLASVTRNRLIVEHLVGVSSRPDRWTGRDGGAASGFLARGVEVSSVDLDEQKYVGIGSFLFAGVLERFLGAYVDDQLVLPRLMARSHAAGREGVIKRWHAAGGRSAVAVAVPKEEAWPAHSVAARLFREPYGFDFFQAVRLLERPRFPSAASVGRAGPPAAESSSLLAPSAAGLSAEQHPLAGAGRRRNRAGNDGDVHGADRPQRRCCRRATTPNC